MAQTEKFSDLSYLLACLTIGTGDKVLPFILPEPLKLENWFFFCLRTDALSNGEIYFWSRGLLRNYTQN